MHRRPPHGRRGVVVVTLLALLLPLQPGQVSEPATECVLEEVGAGEASVDDAGPAGATTSARRGPRPAPAFPPARADAPLASHPAVSPRAPPHA